MCFTPFDWRKGYVKQQDVQFHSIAEDIKVLRAQVTGPRSPSLKVTGHPKYEIADCWPVFLLFSEVE